MGALVDMIFVLGHRQPHLLLLTALLVLSLAPATFAQPADPNNPSTWNITSCALTNLTASVQSFNLILNLATLDLLYLVLPSSTASASLFSLDPNNPNYAATSVSSAPVSTSDYMALYSSATNVSDPTYANNTVIVAGEVAATGATAVTLSLSLPPSSIVTLYYLLADDSVDPPLYSEPLTLPAATNLTVPAACIPPPPLNYCSNLSPTTLLPSYLDPYTLDTSAHSLYTADLSLFRPSTDCVTQRPNVSLCYDCLAVRQRWRCATTFSGCSGDGVVGGGSGGPCRWLCVEKNNRCNEVEDCSAYSTINCNTAWVVTSGGWMWVWLMCAMLVVVMT